MSNKVKVVIHGHFYQPPREDPWTNEIDDQSSSYPHKNWNFKINSECYRPNAFSRVLNEKGMIIDIVNNYQYLSFNFGPTLMEWLRKYDNEIYNKILDADRLSIERNNGHGNAIAQVYNHSILPLLTFEDKKTQIHWGLKDFEYRFKRKSEGIWLTECAVDYKTIDILIEQGVKFIILSPNQALSIRRIGENDWTPINETKLDVSMPYKIIRSHGELDIFFFDKKISSGISFEHLLRSSDDLSYKLVNSAKDTIYNTTIVATDGEIFGHHEPFGDMCISSLVDRYKNVFEWTNFGNILENHKAEYEVNLYMGEDGLGSSWSCPHGVGRWYRDCGCKVGGQNDWNQRWRKPLKESFDYVKKEIDNFYFSKTIDIITSPNDLRNDYINFILRDNYDLNDYSFINKYLKKDVSDNEKSDIMELLYAQKLSMYMFTSCGWFFSEVSGLETVQNLKYANKAISIVENFGLNIREKFEAILEEAKSNIFELSNAKWILNNWINNNIQDKYHIANNFITIILNNLDMKNISLSNTYSYYDYRIKKINMFQELYKGNITIYNKNSHIKEQFSFLINKKQNIKYILYITDIENDKELYENRDLIISDNYPEKFFYKIITENDLLVEIKNKLVENITKEYTQKIFNRNIDSMDDIKEILSKYKNINLDLTSSIKDLIKNIIEIYLQKIANEITDFPDEKLEANLTSLFELVNHFDIKIDSYTLKNKLTLILYNALSDDNDTESTKYSNAIKLINFTNRIKLIVEKSKLENKIFEILKYNMPELINTLNNTFEEIEKVKIMIKIRRLIMLAEIFNINTEDYKKSFFSTF